MLKYEDFINESKKKHQKWGTWEWFIERHGTLNDAGEWDFDTDVNLTKLKRVKTNIIRNGKFTIKFGTVKGKFVCNGLGLTSFYNFPHTIESGLIANDNDFGNLGGLSRIDAQNYNIYNSNLTSLEGSPKVIKGAFLINNNENLGNLIGGPEKVGGAFRADECGLTSLEGAPKVVNDFVTFTQNNLLRLEHMPLVKNKKNKTSIDFRHNDLRTLKHFKWSDSLERVNLERNPNLDTLYGLERRNGLPHFTTLNLDTTGKNLVTETEKRFVTWGKDFNKEDYWDKLLDFAVKGQDPSDIALINWPDEFVEKIGFEKMQNLIKSGTGINKYSI